jgi:hypothetical protein
LLRGTGGSTAGTAGVSAERNENVRIMRHRAAGLGRSCLALVLAASVAGPAAAFPEGMRMTDDKTAVFHIGRSDFALPEPPFKLATDVLWFGPLALFGAGVTAVFALYRRRPGETEGRTLTAEEERQLRLLLQEKRRS